jgi:LmeA-like phospholipid-binding
MSQTSSEETPAKSTRMIAKVLTKALKLWLRSQTSQIGHLDVQITASDRQLLSGSIPQVSIFAQNAVYQGLHLTEANLTAENIRINIGSILKGQPLKLSEPIPVCGNVVLTEAGLNASLASTLLTNALNDALIKLIPEYSQKSKKIVWQKIIVGNKCLQLFAADTFQDNQLLEIMLELELLSGHELQIRANRTQSCSDTAANVEPKQCLEQYLDLGTDVDIQQLNLFPNQLECQGRIKINP